MVQFPHAAALLSSISAVSAVALLVGCSAEGSSTAAQQETEGTEMLTVSINETLPFDETSFTQGLEVAPDGTLYVATGMNGESRIYRTTTEGKELASQDLAPEFFGEGITRVGDHLWQLTWQSNTAIKRDAETLDELERTSFDGEGWGLCHRQDAGEVIFSDGPAARGHQRERVRRRRYLRQYFHHDGHRAHRREDRKGRGAYRRLRPPQQRLPRPEPCVERDRPYPRQRQ